MKILVTQSEIEAAGKTLGFGAVHAFEQFSTADANGNREFEFEMFSRIIRSYTGRQAAPEPMQNLAPSPAWNPAKAADIIAARRKICGSCEWNIDDLCQHPACLTCPGKQKNAGALLTFTDQPFSKCPAFKWNFKI